MKKRIFLKAILISCSGFLSSAYLTACGGGGSSGSSTTTTSSSSPAPSLAISGPIKNVDIDIRFALGGTDANGNGINSSGQINSLFNLVKSLGYNTVTMYLQAGINAQTGLVGPGGPQNALPADFWQEVDYAHSIGLNVNVKAPIGISVLADGTVSGADANFTSTTPLGAGITPSFVFANVAAYIKNMAIQAQAHRANGFWIGHNNQGFDQGDSATAYFGPIIAAVKSVYSGPIGYEASYNNTVFGMVNVIDLNVNPKISSVPMYDVNQIVAGWDSTGTTAWIKNIVAAYPGKTFLIDYHPESGDSGIGTGNTAFGKFITGGIDALAGMQANYAQQAVAYQAFIQVAKNTGVSGVTTAEFAPWSQNTWLSPGFKLMAPLGDDLYFSAPSQNAIRAAFTTYTS